MEKNLLSIGWASADISTEGPINLPGQFHMRISTGILDPITATALWISDGNDDVCFLSIDLVTCRGGLTDAIKEEVAKRNGDIPVEKILLNVTHTHSGPGFHKDNVTGADGTLEGDVPIPTSIEIMDGLEYRKFMVDKIASAVCEAWEKRSHGAIAYGYGYAVVAHSRRVLYTDDVSKRPGAVNNSTHGVNGHAVMYGNTADSKFSGYEGGADHFTNLLFTFDEKKKLTGVLVNVPCPSQNSEAIYKLSASFWNETREAIRKKFGNIFILDGHKKRFKVFMALGHFKACSILLSFHALFFPFMAHKLIIPFNFVHGVGNTLPRFKLNDPGNRLVAPKDRRQFAQTQK